MPLPAAGPLQVTLLGPLRAAGPDGTTLVPVSGRSANLIAALALAPGRSLTTDRAIDLTWPDGRPASGRAALQTLVSRLRSAVRPGLLASTPTGYRLDVEPGDVDLDRAADLLRHATQAARDGDVAGAHDLAADALVLWTGSPATDVPDPELAAEVAGRADAVELELLRTSAEALVLLGDPGAVEASATLVDRAPLDDSAHLVRLRALHAAGRTTEAVAEFGAYRERLHDTLGTDPSGDLAAFHLRLLRAGDGVATGPAAPERPDPQGRQDPQGRPDRQGGQGRPERPERQPGRTPTGIRAYTDELLGRDEDLLRVETALGSARVVTVLGPGGMGKTRLGQEAARRAVARGESTTVIELVGARDASDVLPVVAAALGVPETAVLLGVPDVRTRSLADRVLDRLAERPVLLLLDNCEHVLDGVALWVADALAAVPTLRVLTTSRAPLGVPGERVHPLEPLPALTSDGEPGPAVQLFVERATAVRPSVALPTEAVVRLCERLDGLPLAIELAAARTRSMTVAEIERRLTDRFALLVGGVVTAPARHRTLRAVIAWSWDLLTEDQRVLCRRMCCFADGFTAGAAAYAGRHAGSGPDDDPDPGLLDDLDALVAQSLLRVEDDPTTGGARYRMLETVREYAAREAADAGEQALVRTVLVDWARDLCHARYDLAESAERLLLDPVVARELETLVLALRAALDDDRADAAAALYPVVGLLWSLQGAYQELVALAPRALAVWDAAWDVCRRADRPARVPARDAELLVLGLATIATMELMFADMRSGAVAWRAVRRVLATDPPLRPATRMLVELVARSQDVAVVDALLAEGRASTDLPSRRLAHLASWVIAENAGRIEESIAYARDAYEQAAETHDPWWRALCATTIAGSYGQSRHPQEAWDWAQVAEREIAALRDAHETAIAVELRSAATQVQAVALLTLGDLDRAETHLTAMTQDPEQPLDAVMLATIGLAEVARGRGDVSLAVERYRAALPLSHRTIGRATDPWTLIVSGAFLGAHALMGRASDPEATAVVAVVRDLVLGRQATRHAHSDLPVLGAAMVGVGAWRLVVAPEDPTAAELILLAEHLGSRQDFPSLDRERHRRRAEQVLGTAVVRAVDESVRALPRAAHVPRAVELLRSLPVGP